MSYPQNCVKCNSGSLLSCPPTLEHFHSASSYIKTGFTPEVTLRKFGVESDWDLASPYVVHSCLHAQWFYILELVRGGDKDFVMRCEQASQSRAVKALGVGGVSQM